MNGHQRPSKIHGVHGWIHFHNLWIIVQASNKFANIWGSCVIINFISVRLMILFAATALMPWSEGFVPEWEGVVMYAGIFEICSVENAIVYSLGGCINRTVFFFIGEEFFCFQQQIKPPISCHESSFDPWHLKHFKYVKIWHDPLVW